MDSRPISQIRKFLKTSGLFDGKWQLEWDGGIFVLGVDGFPLKTPGFLGL